MPNPRQVFFCVNVLVSLFLNLLQKYSFKDKQREHEVYMAKLFKTTDTCDTARTCVLVLACSYLRAVFSKNKTFGILDAYWCITCTRAKKKH